MRITAIETIVHQRAITVHAGAISWLWVRLHTDTGLVGLGETYPAAAAAEAAVRESLAPVLLGQDARDIERLWADMFLAIGYWSLPSAAAIARAAEPYAPMWLEELLPQDNLDAYARLRQETSLPFVLSERLMTRWQFREVLERGLAHYINPDACWCGGLTEARKIAAMADTCYVPVAPHNCGGPVLHAACLHLSASVPNFFMLESVRRHYLQDYVGLVSNPWPARDGWLQPPDVPGLGVALDPAVLTRPDVQIRTVSQ